MRRLVLIFFLLAAVPLTLTWILTKNPEPLVDGQQTSVTVRAITVNAKVAASDATRTKGLAGSQQLRDNEGMLFVFDSPAEPVFWMKDVSYALDMIWVRDGSIIAITSDVPAAPDVPDTELKRYRPPGPVDHVLEVAAGWAQRNHVQVGDDVRTD